MAKEKESGIPQSYDIFVAYSLCTQEELLREIPTIENEIFTSVFSATKTLIQCLWIGIVGFVIQLYVYQGLEVVEYNA